MPSYTAIENGTYTLTVTDANGCEGTSDPFVLRLTPEPNFQIESANAEQTNIVALNYNPEDSYQWILPPNADVSQQDNTFTITWNNKYNSGLPVSCKIVNVCNVTTVVPVVPECTDEFVYQNDTSNEDIIFSNIITRSNMVFNGLLTIKTDFTYQDCGIVNFAPGAKVIVKKGATLTIDNCTFTSSNTCCKMWKGIELEPGAKIIVKNNSVISQAEYGIIVNNGSVYDITDSYFRNNYISLQVGTGVNTTNTGSKIFNTDFYSDAHDCGGTTYPNFLPKYEGQTTNPDALPLAGIKADKVSFMKFGSSTPVTGGDVRFNNLMNGIISTNSVVYIQNSSFKNMPNGFGIYSDGGIISLTGLGGDYSASENTFENCGYGVYAKGCDLTVSSVRSSDDVGTAVFYSESGMVHIHNNALGARHYGIRGYNNPNGNAVIEKNTIFMSSNPVVSACIRLDEFGLDNPTTIDYNDLYLNHGRYGILFYGVHNALVKENYILMNHQYNIAGIRMHNSQKNTIQCNTIHALNRYNSNQSGMSLSLSPENTISCNWTSNQFEGMGISGPCSPLEIKGNVFNDHAFGLNLTFNGMMGVQENNGNQWNGNYTYYGAYLSGINSASAKANQVLFFDPSGSNTMPTTTNDVMQLDWFLDNGNPDEFACDFYDCQPFIPIGENDRIEDEIVAENDSIGTEFVDPSNYFADRFLFDRLTENPDLMTGNSILQAFYNQKLYGSIGQFNEMNQEIEDAVSWETVYHIVYATNESMLRTAADSLNIMDSLVAYGYTGPSTYEGLNETIANLNASNELLKETIEQIKNFRIENAIDENAQIQFSDQYEENEAMVNNVYLETVASGRYELSAEQIYDLQQIVIQCPYTGGPSVYKARSLYLLSDETADWDDDAICISNGVQPRKALPESQFALFPNPTTGKLTLKYRLGEEEKGLLNVYNTLGVLVFSAPLNNEEKQIDMDLTMLKPAMYHYKIMVNDIQFKQGMVALIR